MSNLLNMTYPVRMAVPVVLALTMSLSVAAKSVDTTCFPQIPQDAQKRAVATTKDNLKVLVADAEAGNAEAQMALAMVYADNKVIAGRNDMALVWAKRAVEQNATGARDVLMWIQFGIAEQQRTRSYRDPHELWREWAGKGVMFTQYYYAELLNSEQKKQQAAAWYEKAAEQGCMDARTKLAEMQDRKSSHGRIQAYKWIALADYRNDIADHMKSEMDYDEKRVRSYQNTIRWTMSKAEIEKAEKLAEQWASDHGGHYIRRKFPDDFIYYVPEEAITSEIKRSRGSLVVHFTSFDSNCKPCLASNDSINKLSKQHRTKVKFMRVNHEPWWQKSDILSGKHNIKGYPTIVLYQNGRETHRWLGLDVSGLVQTLDAGK